MTTPRRLFALIAAVVALLALVTMLDFREKRSGSEIAAPTPPTPEVEATTALPSPMGEIPEEELRSALTDVCTNMSSESNDREWAQEDGHDQIDAYNKLKLSLSERLSVSSSGEHLHLAAMLENDPASQPNANSS